MNRQEILLRYIKKNEPGVEIGPSLRPIAPKKEGFNVHIIDHLSQEELKTKYKHRNTDIIEKVDFVWNGESYSELTGKKKYYKYVIASHVIEHTPDLIKFINDCDLILHDNGFIVLAIPDKRYCFDYFRPYTGISKIIDSHLANHISPTVGTIVESLLYVTRKGGKIAWNLHEKGDFQLMNTIDQALKFTNPLKKYNKYRDTHVWCFTPNSFRLIIQDLFSLGLIAVKEIDFIQRNNGGEFYIILGRTGKGLKESRLTMLQRIEKEQIEVTKSNQHNIQNIDSGLVTFLRAAIQRVARRFPRLIH